MACVILERTQKLGTKTKVQRQIGTNLPVILGKQCVVVLAIFVVVNSAATKAECRRTQKEILEVGKAVTRVYKKQLPVEYLREKFVEADVGVFTANAYGVLPSYPAQGLDELKVVLGIGSVGLSESGRIEIPNWRR